MHCLRASRSQGSPWLACSRLLVGARLWVLILGAAAVFLTGVRALPAPHAGPTVLT